MEFTRLSLLALFCLVLIRIDASQSGEDYWQSLWPNTPLPNALSDLLMPYSKIKVPIKAEEVKQYWTVFFEHDLYPGKKMNLGIHKHSDIHHSHSAARVPITKPSQPFGARSWGEKESQPFGARSWGEKESQPFEARSWGEKESQPFGARSWGEKESQPFEAQTLGTHEESNQPFRTKIWLEKESKPLEAEIEETSEKVSQPFGTKIWVEKEKQPFRAQTRGPKEDSIDDYCGNPSAIGENKYCALSLKSMMNFAISKLGKDIKVISSSFSPNQEQFVVEEVKKIGDQAVMCHRMNFEKVVFYCHQVNATTTYMVPLVASDGTKSMALTICHHDTRGMDPTLLYDILKVKPGTVPVCHFVGNKAVAWVPNRDVSESHDHPCVV